MHELFVVTRIEVDEYQDEHVSYFDYEAKCEAENAVWKKSRIAAHKFTSYAIASNIIHALIKQYPYSNTCYQIDKIFKA